ncbi:unnamed protein product (macronuclear) [Paramecium tetraurelia]|uniref:Uncharacterized protein n=1 Tax=Paramecium tetraurelia TaxID=5888 RepID=A0BN33_PARTE|nr:uncharacterized protein GSPATT00030588001 [Paramecium tetraurelia]CAK59950.1 unnamed protein product [Paramecium tetraurelia]|eukprot:XP_001427348.1 hypothetical protein (macronuclear) [Paramecium tetraurelia strain d4-2]
MCQIIRSCNQPIEKRQIRLIDERLCQSSKQRQKYHNKCNQKMLIKIQRKLQPVAEIHKKKQPPSVSYSNIMHDIEELMQLCHKKQKTKSKAPDYQ